MRRYKSVGFLHGVVLGVALTTASAAHAETLTLYWNAGHAYQAYADAIAKFEADHPGWSVQWEKFQWPDMRTKLVADFAAKSPPDLVAEPGGWVQEFGQRNLLRPLNDFIEQDGKAIGYPDDWQAYSVERNKLGGQYYGIQIHLTCATLVYNVDMLKQAGFDAPPATWEEFLKVAKATTTGARFGFAPNPSIGYYSSWLLQNGVSYYDPKTNKVNLDSPEAIEAIQFLADLIHKEKAATKPAAGTDYEGPQKLFTANRVAMIITGPWDVKPIRSGNPKLNWAVAPSLKHKVQATFAGGVSVMIPKDAKHPKEAWELLKRLVALDTELAATKEAGMTMPRKSWAENAEVQADPVIGSFSKCLPYAQDVTAELRLTGKHARIEKLLQSALEDIIYNQKPAAEIMPKFAAEANVILANN
ncbi:sugar ABC transporter substrate-binding protein [Mesorhizobium sp. M0998]|uniref:ABC transporter substrate-binding protein n=1 Tax=Mesorhizobium sp. M0998 TaxID=2957044 RepID=UPI00333B5ADC